MTLDSKGRSHKPRGLPQREAGTYDTMTAATGDDDLDTDPTDADEVETPDVTPMLRQAAAEYGTDTWKLHPVRLVRNGDRPATLILRHDDWGEIAVTPDEQENIPQGIDITYPDTTSDINYDDPWAQVDDTTAIDFNQEQPQKPKPDPVGEQWAHAAYLRPWKGDVDTNTLLEYLPIRLDKKDAKPLRLHVSKKDGRARLQYVDVSRIPHRTRTITTEIPQGMRDGDSLLYDGAHWRIEHLEPRDMSNTTLPVTVIDVDGTRTQYGGRQPVNIDVDFGAANTPTQPQSKRKKRTPRHTDTDEDQPITVIRPDGTRIQYWTRPQAATPARQPTRQNPTSQQPHTRTTPAYAQPYRRQRTTIRHGLALFTRSLLRRIWQGIRNILR